MIHVFIRDLLVFKFSPPAFFQAFNWIYKYNIVVTLFAYIDLAAGTISSSVRTSGGIMIWYFAVTLAIVLSPP